MELEEPVKEVTPKASLGDNAPGARPGRTTAAMQQDTHPIQIAIQQMAQATGGRIFRRSGNMVAALNSVIEDGRAAYLLSFAPDSPPDDQYHRLTVRVATRRGVTLRYRTGYLYAKEPATLKDRFEQAIWQPLDATEIAISAHPGAASSGAALTLRIAATDVSLTQQGDRWIGKLDIFLVQRDDTGIHARVNGQSLVLRLKPATWQKLLSDGIPFDQFVGAATGHRDSAHHCCGRKLRPHRLHHASRRDPENRCRIEAEFKGGIRPYFLPARFRGLGFPGASEATSFSRSATRRFSSPTSSVSGSSPLPWPTG